MNPVASQDFGNVLREWRAARRMSQLDLGLEANVSARHISFLETGRARPSRQMALMLGETLDLPLAARNRLLEAAGYAAAYGRRNLDSDDMRVVREAVGWMLDRHAPYPALALDRQWSVVRANAPAAVLLAAFGLKEGDSLLDALLVPGIGPAAFENWDDVARHMLARLKTENAEAGGDPALEASIRSLAADPALQGAPVSGPMPAFMPTRYRAHGKVWSFFSTIAHFSSAEDVALADLRIELMFPADEKTKAALQHMERPPA